MTTTIYFDMDGVLADWYGRQSEGYDIDAPGYYLSLKPFSQGVSLFRRLYSKESNEVYLASTAPWETPSAWTEKRLWVEKHLGEYATKRLILTHRKDLLLGDYLIDDRVLTYSQR
jgi:5'(3')-deoxyribonucleotidase